jgi:hypothetical protein
MLCIVLNKREVVQRNAHAPIKEEIEDTNGVIRIRLSKKNRQHNGQLTKGQTTIYKTYT